MGVRGGRPTPWCGLNGRVELLRQDLAPESLQAGQIRG